MTLIWAHRGASRDAPENTMEAFALAAAQGADGIELDVQPTADEKLAVFHDDHLDRVTDLTGPLSSKTMSQLKEANAAKLHPGRSPARIPELREVYDFLRGNQLLLNVELKASGQPDAAFLREVAALEGSFGLEGRIIYSSFHHYSLTGLREYLPDAVLCPLYSDPLYQPWEYAARLGARYLHPHWKCCFVDNLIGNSHDRGIGVNTWTVDDAGLTRSLLSLEVDGIITNVPAEALRLRDELCPPS